MSENADYYIEKVRYNKKHDRIVWVSVRENSQNKLGGSYNMVRAKILSLIKGGKQFMTIFRNEEGKYRKGQRVAVVPMQGVDYIRTDATPGEGDQLENVPEY